MSLRSNSIFSDGYSSKMEKVSKYKPAVSNETILATRHEIFFTIVTPVQSTNDVVLLGFWLTLFSWIFIASYTPIYFFVHKLIFLNVYKYSSEYDIRVSVDVFWLRKGPSLKYMRNCWGNEDHPNCVQLRTGGELSHLFSSKLAKTLI